MKNAICAIAALAILAGIVPSARAAGTVAAADTPAKTASGVAFTIPKASSMITHGKVIVLTAPEGDVHLAIVDAGTAANADQAVCSAWPRYPPAQPTRIWSRPGSSAS